LLDQYLAGEFFTVCAIGEFLLQAAKPDCTCQTIIRWCSAEATLGAIAFEQGAIKTIVSTARDISVGWVAIGIYLFIFFRHHSLNLVLFLSAIYSDKQGSSIVELT
jgi:hypothetical protein